MNYSNIDKANHRKNVTVKDVAVEFREPFILNGYRPTNNTFLCYVKSVFYLNNETLNFWSHFLPLIYSGCETLKIYLAIHATKGHFSWPFFVYSLTTTLVFLTSCLAHLFNSKSSIMRHVCFMSDYLSISFFGLGAAFAYKAYTITNMSHTINTRNTFDNYILTSLVLLSLANVITCSSRFIMSNSKRICLRAAFFIGPYVLVNSPLWYRLLFKYFPAVLRRVNFVFNIFSSSNDLDFDTLPIATEWDYADKLYLGYFVMACVSIFFYASHLPERCCPGKYDLVGQSHQIFHLTSMLSILLQSKAIESDMKQLISFCEDKNGGLDCLQFYGLHFELANYMCCLLAANCIILFVFYLKAKYFNPWTQQQQQKHKNF